MSETLLTAYDLDGARFDEAGSALAQELAHRVPRPIEVLELAAVIESIGVTDSVAFEDYGASSSFELADRLFPLVQSAAFERFSPEREADDPQLQQREAESTRLDAAVRGTLAIVPLALLLVAMHIMAASGWPTEKILALALGVTAAMACTAGPLVAIGRRTSIYIGFGYRRSARQFLIRSSLTTLVACTAIATATLALSSAMEIATPAERWIFTVSLVGYAMLWLLAAGVLMEGHPLRAVGSLSLGLLAGIAVGATFGSSTKGLATGYLVAIGMLAAAWAAVFRVTNDTRAPLRLPSAGLASLEAAPYVAFGSLFAVFLVEPHVLAWLGSSDEGPVSMLAALELSFTLALPPILVAGGVHEHSMRGFWVFLRRCQRTSDRCMFSRRVGSFHWREFKRYAAALGTLSIAMVICFEIVFLSGGFDGASQLVFLCAIVALFFVGLGQFNTLLMLSLAPPSHAVRPLLAGVVMLTVLGVPLTLIDFRLAALGFALGACAFAAAAVWSCRDVLENVDHYYATAF